MIRYQIIKAMVFTHSIKGNTTIINLKTGRMCRRKRVINKPKIKETLNPK